MKPLVTDELWEMVAPLLPRRRPQPKGGRPWVDPGSCNRSSSLAERVRRA